jgi:hypothetical protein
MENQPPAPPAPPAEPVAPPEDDAAQIQNGAGILVEFLQTHPAHGACVDRVLRQHLNSSAIGPDTWNRILNGLNLYAGEDLTTFLLVSILRSNEPEFVSLLKEHSAPEAWSYLYGLIALYSDDLREAYAIFGENPSGWRTVNRRVFYDYLTGSWHAMFEIIRFNGEQVLLDETPKSAIVLCQAILDALNAIPPDIAPQLADPESVENLVSLFSTFIERFAPHLLNTDAESE